ncbi:Uncharacterized protein Rs2_21190 [Raphanus sativus]|nr:Uncharacterized protein Rs2_21190 [Raphanus sativus]
MVLKRNYIASSNREIHLKGNRGDGEHHRCRLLPHAVAKSRSLIAVKIPVHFGPRFCRGSLTQNFKAPAEGRPNLWSLWRLLSLFYRKVQKFFELFVASGTPTTKKIRPSNVLFNNRHFMVTKESFQQINFSFLENYEDLFFLTCISVVSFLRRLENT